MTKRMGFDRCKVRFRLRVSNECEKIEDNKNCKYAITVNINKSKKRDKDSEKNGLGNSAFGLSALGLQPH
jgi:hypothetical protein